MIQSTLLVTIGEPTDIAPEQLRHHSTLSPISLFFCPHHCRRSTVSRNVTILSDSMGM